MTREISFRDAEPPSRVVRAINGVGRRLASAGVRRPSLDPDAIIAAAAKTAGTDIAADGDFHEPLALYTADAEAVAELNLIGRAAVRAMLTAALANRAAIFEYADAHPHVSAEAITAPWVIIGLPRTGTTLLSMLLDLDPHARSLRTWEATHPIPPATLATRQDDERIASSAADLAKLEQLNPALQAMHPTGAMLPQECVALFMYELRSLALETMALVPNYGRWLAQTDMSSAYAIHKLTLQCLQSTQPTDHWVLKTPNHLWNIPELLATYPDARIIWTHRDPAAVVPSLASLVNGLQRPFTDRRDPRPTAENWLDKAKDGLAKAMAYDDSASDDWCVHVQYDDLVNDPSGTVADIYATFGQTPSDLHQRRMAAWVAQRPQTHFGRHVYRAEDFGWTDEQIRRELADYTDRYGTVAS